MMSQPTPTQQRALFFLLVVGLAVALFFPVGGFRFLNWDDNIYLQDNPHLREVFTAASLEWAFTANLTHFDKTAEYWSPLTLLTRLADAHFFGISPGAMHITSVVLHTLNACLLALALHAFTGAWRRSCVVALLFLVHPQNIEPVLWLSARKDVVAATFFFLTLLAYARYARQPGRGRYAVLLLAFIAALMAKPMAVSVPILLLLLDFWPLRRWQDRATNLRLLAEKVPLFILAGLAAGLAVLAQADVGAMGSYPLPARIANALYATATYVRRAVWPSDLCVFYPHTDGALSVGLIASCVAALLVITFLAWRARPLAMVGWLWFLAGLAPVIGLVQVGRQAMADRYFYTTGIGLFIAAVWLGAEWVKSRALQRAIATAAVVALAVVAHFQVQYWRDSGAAFQRAIAVTERNFMAHGNLGTFYFLQGELDRAKTHFMESLAIDPFQFTAWNNLGAVEAKLNRPAAAIHAYQRAVILDAKSTTAHFILGRLLVNNGRIDEAVPYLQRAAELAPHWPEPKKLLAELGR